LADNILDNSGSHSSMLQICTFSLTSSQILSPSPRLPVCKSARLVSDTTSGLFLAVIDLATNIPYAGAVIAHHKHAPTGSMEQGPSTDIAPLVTGFYYGDTLPQWEAASKLSA
jgi:hypothetical protein